MRGLRPLFLRRAFLRLVSLLLSVLPATPAIAADWSVMQVANLSVSAPGLRLQQLNTTSGSSQALNGIVLGADDVLVSATQTANFGGNGLSLSQNGVGNVQAVNLASAAAINALTQRVENAGGVSLSQGAPSDSGNVQALNYARADEEIANAQQTVTANGVAFSRAVNTPADNIQSVNFMQANRYRGNITQRLNINSGGQLTAPGNSGSSVRANSIQGNTTAATITQTVMVDSVVVDATDYTTLILNHVAP